MSAAVPPHPDELWDLLVEVAAAESFPAGQVLIQEGQPADAVYFLIRGNVSVARNGQEIARQSAGSVLGELSVLMNDQRHATVTCLDNVEVLRVASAHFLRILDQFPAFTRSILHEAVAKLLPGQEQLPTFAGPKLAVGWEKLFQAYSKGQTTQTSCWQRIGLWGDKSCPELLKVAHCRNCPVFAEAGRQLLERRPRIDYLEEWAQAVALPKRKAKVETQSVIVFRVEEEWLALRAQIFQEITDWRPIHAIPHRTTEVLLGLVNVRGELLLAFSLGRMIGLDAAPSSRPNHAAKLIVVQNQGHRSVFPVAEILCIYELPNEERQNVPVTLAKSASSFSTALFQCEGRHVSLLDDELLFFTLEKTLT